MRIGILTFWWSNDNYGQLLQCYALQKFLRNMGHDPYFIRYRKENDIKKTPLLFRCLKAFNPVKLVKLIKFKIHTLNVQTEQKRNNRYFDTFRSKYFSMSDSIYTSINSLRNNPPEADAYIVGSDQVWNNWGYSLKKYKNPLHTYFLDFGRDDIKRISYAASWGIKKLKQEYIHEIQKMLKRFDFVSVREKNGVELCRKCGCNNVQWVCDPTLLLSAREYRSLYQENEIQKPSSPYLLLYMLNNKCNFNIQAVYDFADLNNLAVVYVTGNGVIDEKKKTFATIPEWLYLVDNADYVITNSFHCGVFSTIFHKQF